MKLSGQQDHCEDDDPTELEILFEEDDVIPEESGLGESDVESEAHVTAAFPSVPDGSKSSCCFPGRKKDPRTKNTKCVARLQEVTDQTNLLRRCLRVSLFTGLVSCQGTYLFKKLQRRTRLPLREMGTASEVEEKASERKVIGRQTRAGIQLSLTVLNDGKQ